MQISTNNPNYKSPVSVRFRADPNDRHASSSSSASPPLNPVGVDTLDAKIQNIETLREKLQTHRSTLNELISRFLQNKTSDIRTLEDVLTQLRTLLEPYKWRLERPKRYQMHLILSTASAGTAVLINQVLLFNQINMLCAETIKMAIELKALVDRFLSESEMLSSSYLADTADSRNRDDDAPDRTAYLVAATRDLGRNELDRRITEFRCRYANEHSVRLIGQDADKTLLEIRKLFYDLVRSCAVCLV